MSNQKKPLKIKKQSLADHDATFSKMSALQAKIASLPTTSKYLDASMPTSMSEIFAKQSSLFASINLAKAIGITPIPDLTRAAFSTASLFPTLQFENLAERLIKQSSGYQFDFLKSASFIKSLHSMLPDNAAIQEAIGISEITRTALLSNFDVLNAATSLANQSLANFDWNHIGRFIGISKPVQTIVKRHSIDFVGKYSAFVEAIPEAPDSSDNINPALAKLTSYEYLTGAEALESISTKDINHAKEVNETKQEIALEAKYNIESYLPRINKDFPILWQGANEVINSNGVDKVRHYTTSVRELFTQIMHCLAPDEALKNWSTNPNDFSHGRPTRNARLQYIYRHIKNDTFKEFVDADVKMTLALIDTFQKGTHGVNNPFSDPQLLAIRDKVQSTLSYILMTHFSNNIH